MDAESGNSGPSARALAYPWPHAPRRAPARDAVHAYVYKSLRKADTYVYLAARDGFGRLPAALRAELEPFDFVLEVALTPGRRLARANADEVRAALAARGFHLQLPPSAAALAANGDLRGRG